MNRKLANMWGNLLFGKAKRTFFCSYRSPKYDDLKQHQCAMLYNPTNKCQAGNIVFNSCKYTECAYKKLVHAASNLIRQYSASVKYYRHIPPMYILPKNVILTPLQMMELTPRMFNEMIESKYFVYFQLDEQNDSFWTVLEKEIWKNIQLFHKRKPYVYIASKEKLIGEYELEGDVSEPLSDICSKIRTQDKLWVGPVPPPLPTWSKLSSEVYLQQCPTCGQVFILSSAFIHRAITKEKNVNCPYCGDSTFQYFTHEGYITYKHEGDEKCNSIISPNFVANFLYIKDVPASIPYLTT